MNTIAITAALFAATYFVSPKGDDANDGSAARPVATLNRAIELARWQLKDEPREIVVRDGMYFVEKPAALTKDDADLVIRAEHRGKALFTGAVAVEGFRPDPEDPRFLVAKIPFECTEGARYTLVVNGKLADLAAFPSLGGKEKMPYLADGGESWPGNRTVVKYDSLYFPEGENLSGIDLASTFVFLPQEWVNNVTYIATNDWRNDRIVLKNKAGFDIGVFNTGIQFVNLRLGMRKPGSWMYLAGKGEIVYWPREGETTQTLKARLSKSTQALSIDRTAYITLDGLVFEGFATTPKSSHVIAAGWSNHLTIRHVEVRDSAGYGIMNSHCENSEVSDCHVHHMGTGGICFGGASGGNKVLRCHVHDYGRYSPAADGINVQSRSSLYAWNHVHDAPGNGVVMWSSESVFASNHIHHVMQSQRDGAGLYGAYDRTLVIGNRTHDTGQWPGLYNDEGGQMSVFTGNTFENQWWPFHMHDCYGIVITNNTFVCDSFMRYSLQGSTHCVFSNNVIRTATRPGADGNLGACDVWADNPLELKQADGTYRREGVYTLVKEVQPPKEPAKAHRASGPCCTGDGKFDATKMRGPAWNSLGRAKDGRNHHGTPGATVQFAFDKDNLYTTGSYQYGKLTPYAGSVNRGRRWGVHDAVRYHFKNLTFTVYADGTIESTSPAVNVTTNWCRASFSGWKSGSWHATIPLKALGLDGDPVGKTIPFNAEFYNGDHDEYRYFTQPVDGKILVGELAFTEYQVNHLRRVNRRGTRDDDGDYHLTAMAPLGGIEFDLETAYRPGADYANSRAYLPKDSTWMGFTYRDRKAGAGHRAFSLVGGYGEYPADGTRRGERMVKDYFHCWAHRFDLNFDDWDFWTDSTATDRAVYHHFAPWKGGTFTIRVDAAYADGGEVVASDVKIGEDGTLTLHNTVKTGFFSQYDVWGKIGFAEKPLEVKEVTVPGKVGKTYLLKYILMPGGTEMDGIRVKACVSEESEAACAAAYAAEPGPDEYRKVLAATEERWRTILAAMPYDGDEGALRYLSTALANAMTMPGKGNVKRFTIDLSAKASFRVVVRGEVTADGRWKKASYDGAELPNVLPADFFKDGGVLEFEY